MTQNPKNDTLPLLLAFLVTLGLIGVGAWWFTQQASLDLSRLIPGMAPAAPNNPGTGGPSGTSTPSQTGEGFRDIQNVPSGLFSYGGSTSWAPIRSTVDAALQAARPEFQLRYINPVGSAPGSGTGIRMLIQGELGIAQSSRPVLDSELQQAKQRGFNLKQVQVAIDGLAVAVNPDLKLSGITLNQLKDIYSGKLTNWQALGGPNLEIQPLTRPTTAGGTVEFFVEAVLSGAPFGPTVQSIATTTEALRKLASLPGGIYYASAPEVVPQCTVKSLSIGRKPNELVTPYQGSLVSPDQCRQGQRNQLNIAAFQAGQYPLTRNLYVIVKQNGQTEEQAGEAYANFLLTAQGQDLISKAGFVRIR